MSTATFHIENVPEYQNQKIKAICFSQDVASGKLVPATAKGVSMATDKPIEFVAGIKTTPYRLSNSTHVNMQCASKPFPEKRPILVPFAEPGKKAPAL
ncbi:hypothetical protein [Aliiroseovarius sediminis]|uniref:hypothetical protein n=1 Tax=Aliiroseovarius sediminis TaxID=2925839 RepID=UPI001F55C985|nr:hypothetical protein [Aliiroseovarius sediminis]MCI2393927.1 hypothetical protein [Aliiroseovarius sediminis]